MRFSAGHLMSYCRPSISKIPDPFAWATSWFSSNGFSFVNLGQTELLERVARASLPAVPMFYSFFTLLKVMVFGSGFNADSAFQPAKTGLCVWDDLSKQD